MAASDLNFTLPDGKTINMTVEETATVNSLIAHIRNSGLLGDDVCVMMDMAGSVLDDQKTFGNIKGTSFLLDKKSDVQENISPVAGSEGMSIGRISSPQTFHQLGVFLLDGSGSMNSTVRNGISKAQEVNMAMRDLLSRFKASRVGNNFSFTVLNFDTSVTELFDVTPAKDVDDFANFDPTVGHGGGTQIFKAFEEAKKKVDSKIPTNNNTTSNDTTTPVNTNPTAVALSPRSTLITTLFPLNNRQMP